MEPRHCGIIVSKLDLQIISSEFDPHWFPHTRGLLPKLGQI